MEKINSHVWSRYEKLIGSSLSIIKCLDIVSDRQYSFMVMYFKDRKPLDEIAQEVSLSRERVRQIIEKGVRTLESKHEKAIEQINQKENTIPLLKREIKITNDRLRRIKNQMRSCLDFPETEDKQDARIIELDISARLYNVLSSANIKTIKELAAKPKSELRKFRNMGLKTMQEIEDLLFEYGF